MVPASRMMSAWPDMKMGSKPGLQVSCDWLACVTWRHDELWLVQGPISSISSSNCFSGRYSPTYRVPEHQMKRCNNPVTRVTNKTTVGRFAKILLKLLFQILWNYAKFRWHTWQLTTHPDILFSYSHTSYVLAYIWMSSSMVKWLHSIDIWYMNV